MGGEAGSVGGCLRAWMVLLLLDELDELEVLTIFVLLLSLRRVDDRCNLWRSPPPPPPPSVDPDVWETRQLCNELSSRWLRVDPRPVLVNRRNSSLFDIAATIASSKTSLRLRCVRADDSTYVRAPKRLASRIASISPTGFSP